MLSACNRLTVFITLMGLVSCLSANAETIDLSQAKEVPTALTDVLQKLQGRDLQLMDSSMENLDPNLPASPITCEFINKYGETFTVLAPSESHKSWRFATSLNDENGIATVDLGETGGFTWIGFGGVYTYGSSWVTTEPGLVKFNRDFTYIGVNTAISGMISTNLEYVFEPSANHDLSGSIINTSLTIKGGGVHYKRICSYLVK